MIVNNVSLVLGFRGDYDSVAVCLPDGTMATLTCDKGEVTLELFGRKQTTFKIVGNSVKKTYNRRDYAHE